MAMAKGESGRIVIEIDPALKRELYASLSSEGLTLKKWFLTNAEQFLSNRSQISLLDEGTERKVGT